MPIGALLDVSIVGSTSRRSNCRRRWPAGMAVVKDPDGIWMGQCRGDLHFALEAAQRQEVAAIARNHIVRSNIGRALRSEFLDFGMIAARTDWRRDRTDFTGTREICNGTQVWQESGQKG